MEKVMIGLSGGVDSSVATLLLKNEGYSVSGATFKTYSDTINNKNIADAENICKKLKIPHYVIDTKKVFIEKVIEPFISEYENGKTPNPCIECNKHLKFGLMLKEAQKLGNEKIATGHYSKIVKDGSGRYLLLKGEDESKDQTYVLYALTQEQLSKTLMPLGNLKKSEVRELARKSGFENSDKADSQDICFVENGDYYSFIKEYTKKNYPCGEFVDLNGNVLGSHSGVIGYTVGQRKGLGIALGKPTFVIEKDAITNRVVLGDEENLFKKQVKIKDFNFIPFENLSGKLNVTAKLRYKQKEQEAQIEQTGENEVTVTFKEYQRAPSSGQSAVFYDGNIVVGGGIIL